MAEVGNADPNSRDNINTLKGYEAETDDAWATLVRHITGYPVPDRKTIFEKLTSTSGGPLFRMDIRERDLKSVVSESGFLVNEGQDYDIYFLNKNKKTVLMQARIVFEGRVKTSDNDIRFAGTTSEDVDDVSVREGNEFKDYNKQEMSTIPLAQYMNGPRAALMALRDGGTEGVKFAGLQVDDNNAVVLKSFADTGESFDRAAQFFKNKAVVLKDWEDRFAREDASWKGEAADVFRNLLKKVRENYDGYVETFGASTYADDATGSGGTVYSRALSIGSQALKDSATNLLGNWLEWAQSPHYDPLRVLRYLLDDLAMWVNEHNIGQSDIEAYTHTGYQGAGYTSVTHSPKGGFLQEHPIYGDLSDIANWKKIGDRAVELWNQGVDQDLVRPAIAETSKLNNRFLDLTKDFTENVPKPKTTSTAGQDYANDKLNDPTGGGGPDIDEWLEKLNENNNDFLDDLNKNNNDILDDLNSKNNDILDDLNSKNNDFLDDLNKNSSSIFDDLNQNNKTVLDDLGNINNTALDNLNDLGNANNDVLNSLGDLGNANSEALNNLGNLGNLNGGPGAFPPGVIPPVPQSGPVNFGPLNGNQDGTRGNPNEEFTRSLGNLLGNGGLNTPTGGSTRLRDGSITTDFPNGGRSAFDPETGDLTTVSPDGSTVTRNLSGGAKITNPDGSVTSLDRDGNLTTTFPDGSKQVIDPRTGQAVTTNPDGSTTTTDLGNLGGLNNPSGGLDRLDLGGLDGARGGLETPTGGRTSLGLDGDLNSVFPDGSRSSFDPDTGQLTITDPDGSTRTVDLTHGAEVTNPDGSKTVLDNGQLKTTFPDGSVQVTDPETGRTTITDPDGNTRTVDLGGLNNSSGGLDRLDLGGLDGARGGLETPTGGRTSLGLDGDLNSVFPDGSRSSFDPDTGQLTITDPDGSTRTVDLTHGAEVTNPDGSKTVLDNGQLKTTFPDGTVQVTDPETGRTTITDPDGNTRTVDLGGLNNSSGGLDRGPGERLDLGNLGSLNGNSGGGSSGGGPSTVSRDVPLSGLGLGGGGSGGGGSLGPVALDNALLGNGTGDGLNPGQATGPAGPTPGAPGAPGMPGSPGMPMGGAGMGGAGGEKGNGERVRSVLVDAAEESARRKRRRRGAWNRQESEDTFLAPAPRVSTTSNGSDPRAAEEPDNARRTTSSSAYLEEDEDVWGTEEGGSPAVIGR
ncbi:AAWKG family protein [Streptomyces sp. CFMR 7]|uniref:AAWKG family protein n=1 Tax=Streptomyces sp. CFMR 7 TaxID=1649184 RepID=UPI0021B6D054|nr:AAWKG family protein [Streptomyces sp. CFMR 7]